MKERSSDAFGSYHPLVNFSYFILVLIFTMVFLHPICLILSLAGAFLWSAYLGGRRAVRMNLIVMLPMLVITALINPVFSHEGATTLLYLPTGNPLTLESIWFGVATAVLLVAVILWFSCYNRIMTSDKFVYLFGRIIPALSLILSMVLRFVPKFKQQLHVVSSAQRCIGRDSSMGSIWQRARHGVRILSIMVTWALENAIETADSMKSRGYGLAGRTAFSIYRFDRRDALAMSSIVGLGVLIAVLAWRGALYWRFYPSMRGAAFGIWPAMAGLAYCLLCGLPLILDLWEDRKWKHIASKI